ncbi:MAG TPA: energy transducer TonB [Chitinophagales bacterium]|nr:energy transducer TonB [Chitinophagales bacterium]
MQYQVMKKQNTLLLIALFLVTSAGLMAQTSTTKEGDKNFPLIDKMPEATGSDAELIRLIQSQLVYPQKAKDMKIEGVVLVRFEIQEDGTIGEVSVNRGINAALDAEAIRVVKQLPKFIPAKQNGLTVKSYQVIPVEFKLP